MTTNSEDKNVLSLRGSVGQGGENLPEDVEMVRGLLADHGFINIDLNTAIEQFQRTLGMESPDGRVDPGGRTWRGLTGTSDGPLEPTLEGLPLAEPAAEILRRILTASGNTSARITSVERTPADQARVMYENIAAHGVEAQKNLYAEPGREVIDVFASMAGSPKDEVIAAMLAKIEELGPERVSKHCSTSRWVFDVAPSSLENPAAFSAALKTAAGVDRYFEPPRDPAFHIEILKLSV